MLSGRSCPVLSFIWSGLIFSCSPARSKAYDGAGEENLYFESVSCNVGGGLDPQSGIFTAPFSGLYLFLLHIATHDNKKALLSIR